jgi:hypothetical protein
MAAQGPMQRRFSTGSMRSIWRYLVTIWRATSSLCSDSWRQIATSDKGACGGSA